MHRPFGIFLLFSCVGQLVAAEPTSLPDAWFHTQEFTLMNIPAKDAAEGIGNYMKAKRKLFRLADPTKVPSQCTITPKIDTNSLVCRATEDELLEIAALIKKLDRCPDQIVIRVEVSQTGPDKKKVILSRPTIRTLADQTAVIEFGTEDSFMTIEMTPRVIRGDVETKE